MTIRPVARGDCLCFCHVGTIFDCIRADGSTHLSLLVSSCKYNHDSVGLISAPYFTGLRQQDGSQLTFVT